MALSDINFGEYKMKTIIFMPIHSFSETITNSSTELFICNTEKTPEQVKNLLNSFVPSLASSNIKVSLYKGPKDLLKIILRVHDCMYCFSGVHILRKFIPPEVKLDMYPQDICSSEDFIIELVSWFKENEKMLSCFIKDFIVIEDEDNEIEFKFFDEMEDNLNCYRLHLG